VRDPGQAAAAQLRPGCRCLQLRLGRHRSQRESVQVAVVPCARARTSHRYSLRETPATPPPTPALRLRPDLRRRRWTLNPVAGVGHPMGNPLPTWGRVWGFYDPRRVVGRVTGVETLTGGGCGFLPPTGFATHCHPWPEETCTTLP
jgi:hypothetical protein